MGIFGKKPNMPTMKGKLPDKDMPKNSKFEWKEKTINWQCQRCGITRQIKGTGFAKPSYCKPCMIEINKGKAGRNDR